jgi:hypothetical protein
MDAMMVVEPEHSAQAPQAHNEPNEELALWRQLLGIIRDAEWQIGWGPVFLHALWFYIGGSKCASRRAA